MQTELQSSIAGAGALAGLALALGARNIAGWTDAEEKIAYGADSCCHRIVEQVKEEIAYGGDPLGDAFCRGVSTQERRLVGATYTPQPIVDAMLNWASGQINPVRVVDPGAGSARFLVAAGRRFPDAELLASEINPLAAIIARGHISAAGLAGRSRVVVGDYRQLRLPRAAGPTLFIGNPPYVRHHLIDHEWKMWLANTAKAAGLNASQLAGLHVYFFLATANLGRSGDIGAFITAAEWLDVNYGQLVRKLLLDRLGVRNLQIIEPSAEPFPGTKTTAVISGFEIGATPQRIGVRRVAEITKLDNLQPESLVLRQHFENADRWTPITRAERKRRQGFVELGELCRVHRGQATGANAVWIVNQRSINLPTSVLYPSVTRARELISAGEVLHDSSQLRLVIDLPQDLTIFDAYDRKCVDDFLRHAKSLGAHEVFLARQRKAWWAIGLRNPAPILATYMARRPPAFVRNLVNARHLNIGHGLYPRDHLTDSQLATLVSFLSISVHVDEGRTYAGGLTKFEPREMERVLVPSPDLLSDPAFA